MFCHTQKEYMYTNSCLPGSLVFGICCYKHACQYFKALELTPTMDKIFKVAKAINLVFTRRRISMILSKDNFVTKQAIFECIFPEYVLTADHNWNVFLIQI